MFTILGWFILSGIANAHCDSLDGPVVSTAKSALEAADITPVLKWVRANDENEIRNLFNKTLVVRKQGKDARELADRYFLESLVRIHRAGEGAPYTGLKPAGTANPAVYAADRALQNGSVDELLDIITGPAVRGIRERFELTREAQKNAGHSVEEGRKYVEAYIEFTHYVERLHNDATAKSVHGKSDIGPAGQHHAH